MTKSQKSADFNYGKTKWEANIALPGELQMLNYEKKIVKSAQVIKFCRNSFSSKSEVQTIILQDFVIDLCWRPNKISWYESVNKRWESFFDFSIFSKVDLRFVHKVFCEIWQNKKVCKIVQNVWHEFFPRSSSAVQDSI